MARQFLTTLITLTVLTFCSTLIAQESTKLEGLASVMKDSSYVHEYVALHPQIAKGTLIEVKNKKNGRIAVVKVVGKPKSARKSNVLIYISKKAYQKLQSPNPTFAVELNYKTNSESDAYVVDPIRIQQENEASQNPFAQPYQPNFVQNNDPFGAVDQNIQNNNQPIIHIVNASQTSIYSIARLYNIYDARKVAQWNKLGNRVSLTPGQRLTIYPEVGAPRFNNSDTFNSIGKPRTVRENGFAELIRNIKNPKPFVALHKSEPVGTLITIKNKASGRAVVVTVVGPLDNPQTGTIIQITDATYRRLGSNNAKFPVEMSYISRGGKVQSSTNTNQGTTVSYSSAIKTKAAYLPDDMLADKWWVAFHKTAPIGSYIQVRNPQNSQSATLLVAGKLQGKVSDKQMVMQIGQAGMQALNDGETTETLPVTVEQIKGIKEGNMERVINDIANVYEEGMGKSFKAKSNQKFTCLHKSAPIGTLILVEKVRTPVTNNTTYTNFFGANTNRATNTTNPFSTNNNNNDPFVGVTTVNNNPFNNSTQLTTNTSNSFQTQNVNPATTTKYYRVIVEVVGKLPDTEANKDIIIKLSDDAFNGLSDGKKSLPLKLSYFEL